MKGLPKPPGIQGGRHQTRPARSGPLGRTALQARRAALGLVVALLLPSSAAAQEQGFQPRDYYELVSVGEVAVRPSGDMVAFTVTTVVEADNERHREVWLQTLEGGRPSGDPIRFTDPTVESSEPVWSPDGSLLAFRSRRGEDPVDVWFARVDGPAGAPYHVPGVRGSPVWSPDGEWIAFVDAGDDDENGDEREGWIAPDAVTNTLDPERFDGRVITSLRYKQDGVATLLPHFSAREKRQLWVVPARGGEAERLTSLPFDVSDPVWSRDGRYLFFSGDEFQDDEQNLEETEDIWAVAAQGGSVRRLTGSPGSESAPALSADGERLAFLSTPGQGAPTDLLVVDVAPDGTFRGEPVNLTAGWDFEPGEPVWGPADSVVKFRAGVGGDWHLFQIPAAGGEVTRATHGSRRLSDFSFSDDGALTAYTATDPVSPAEVYVQDDTGLEVRVTGFNDGLLARRTLMPAGRLTWTVEDGTEIEGWLIPPVGYEPGRSYPMVLKIHGGPHGAYGNYFFPTFHVLSDAGFFVLYSNPRGSSNYGHAFEQSTRGAWGLMDKEDFLTGVDAALAANPDIDETRLGVAGGSYGGFMTNWLTATTDRFDAAVTSRSIASWESLYGGSDIGVILEYELLGPPWEQRGLYRRLSPISYVENVTAPTLIIHSEQDYRTPMADADLWFTALKRRGVPVEMVRYPRSSHGLSRTGEPWLLVDRLERIRSWFVHWLVDEPRSEVAAGR